jgi:Zn-dependent peptidase ImmA (M78 family)
VGGNEAQTTRLTRLRAMTPNWPLSAQEARWVAEQQAALLLAEARTAAPPVPEQIVRNLAGVHVYELDILPVLGLLSASKPSGRGGDIVIDSTLSLPERRVTLLHELKHIIDGHTGDACEAFAASALVPARWLHADWQAGRRNLSELADRYLVPTETVEYQVHQLGLIKSRPRHRHRAHCQMAAQNVKSTTTDRRQTPNRRVNQPARGGNDI